MTTQLLHTHSEDEPINFLRWVFVRDTQRVTCDVMLSGPHAVDVCVRPGWDCSGTLVERYGRLGTALRRHAEIGRLFRQAGWKLVLNDDRPIAAA
jgi:hypothetical protein